MSTNRDKSRIIFNFKVGNHNLPVERLRYTQVPRHRRHCTNFACRHQFLTGDESHIFRCPKNKKALLNIWKFLSTDPRIDTNSQSEIQELICSSIDNYWTAAWARTWEMSLDRCMYLSLTLCTKSILQIIKKYWSPFKHTDCT